MIATALLFLKSNWRILLAAIALMPLVFMLGECDGRKVGRAQMTHAIDRANLAAAMQKARADENADNQRLTDTIAVNHQEQELRNVVAQTPDSAPDAVRIALGCERLRRANGSGSAALPAVCGSSR